MDYNSTWLITSELANQRARKVLFTCVVYTPVLRANMRGMGWTTTKTMGNYLYIYVNLRSRIKLCQNRCFKCPSYEHWCLCWSSVSFWSLLSLTRTERSHAKLTVQQHSIVKDLRLICYLVRAVNCRQRFGVSHFDVSRTISLFENSHSTDNLTKFVRSSAIETQPFGWKYL